VSSELSPNRDDLTKEYATDEIVVEWQPRLWRRAGHRRRGHVLYEGERAALCRCGGSSNKPFCDGTHKKNGFRG
jgi:hypothetical protein